MRDSISVRFGEEQIDVNTADNKAFRVEPLTEQKFVVFQNGTEVETDTLKIRQGDKVVLKIDVVDGQVQIASNVKDINVTQDKTEQLTTKPSEVPNDRKQIQGTWKVIYSADSGRDMPQEQLKALRFTIKADSLVMDAGGRVSNITYKLDPTTSPKSIDLIDEGSMTPGIYELTGDVLRICINEDDGPRPTEFASQPNSVNDVLIMLHRVDTVAEQRAAKDAQFEGVWRVVFYQQDGRLIDHREDNKLEIELGVNQAVLRWYLGENEDQVATSIYRLTPGKSPGWLDSSSKDGKQGIYQVEGDVCTICLADERPTTFEAKPGATLITLRRDTSVLTVAAATALTLPGMRQLVGHRAADAPTVVAAQARPGTRPWADLIPSTQDAYEAIETWMGHVLQVEQGDSNREMIPSNFPVPVIY